MSYKNLQHYRCTVHRYLDAIWLTSSKKRNARTAMYSHLSRLMNLPLEATHAKYFTRNQCRQAIKILRPMYIQLYGKDLDYERKEKTVGKEYLGISNEVTFETAHILSEIQTSNIGKLKQGYDSLYSHSYTLYAEVESSDLNEMGLFMTFEELGQALMDIVPDHMFVYNTNDKIGKDIQGILDKYNIPYIGLPFDITSENMVKYLKGELKKYIQEEYGYRNIKIPRIEIIGTVDRRKAYIIER